MNNEKPFQGETIHFVTGRLAESSLREVVRAVAEQCGFEPSIQVLPITVAALMTPRWIAKHIEIPPRCDRIILPGYCQGDLTPITTLTRAAVQFGPKDLRRMPEFFGKPQVEDLSEDYDIEIIAEINHAPSLPMEQIHAIADDFVSAGANVIDIGCDPDSNWTEVGTVVRELRQRGLRVSIDSMNPQEVALAAAAGAELALSVNSSNRRAAVDWGCEVVVIPDQMETWFEMADTIEFLAVRNVSLRIDPILEPIGLGFAESIGRYIEARRIWPDAEMMMGIGNLTELTDVDSAGVNVLLLAVCQELGISSVLTTQVINWARTSVKECDIARRLVHAAYRRRIPPKNLDPRLVCLRDPQLLELGGQSIQDLVKNIRDNNYRIFAENDEIHLLGGGKHWQNNDAFELFHELMESKPKNIDASHAFYLGYEMCKATIALQLGKQYEQDEALNWGHLTIAETNRRRLQRRRKK